MKLYILAAIFVMLIGFTNASDNKPADENDDDDEITTLTFLAEYEPEPDNDFIEIQLSVEAKSASLKTAIEKVTDVVNKVKALAVAFCNQNAEEGKDTDCDSIVEVEDFEIEAEYVRRRKDEQVFQDFVVSHDVTIRIDNTDEIGEIGDKLLKLQNTKIESFDWASDKQDDDDEEQAIEAGKQKAVQMCFHLGMKLHRIVSVEAIEDDDEDEKEDDKKEEDDEDDDQEEPLVYKFEVECIVDAEAAAKKEAEQLEEQRAKEAQQARLKVKQEQDSKDKKKKKTTKTQKVEKPQKQESDKKKKKK